MTFENRAARIETERSGVFRTEPGPDPPGRASSLGPLLLRVLFRALFPSLARAAFVYPV